MCDEEVKRERKQNWEERKCKKEMTEDRQEDKRTRTQRGKKKQKNMKCEERCDEKVKEKKEMGVIEENDARGEDEEKMRKRGGSSGFCSARRSGR